MKSNINIHGLKMPRASHTLVTGGSGSGKTRSILRPLVREYLSRDVDDPEAKVGMLLIDPKGDMLDWVQELLCSLGREDDLVVIGEGKKGFNLFSGLPLSAPQYAVRLSALANSLNQLTENRGEAEYWLHQQRIILEALIQVAKVQPRSEPMKIADIVSLRFKLLPHLRTDFEHLKLKFHFHEMSEVKQVLKDFVNLPNDTRECVLSTVSNCLSVFHQEPLRELLNPAPDKNVDLVDIIQKGKCVVVACATRSYGNVSMPVLLAVKEAFADLILSRAEIEVEEGGVFEKLNADREVLYVADEAHRVLLRGNTGGELDFIDVCREFRCRAILATQSLSAIQSVMGTIPANRFISLFGNFFFMNSIDPESCAWADRMFRAQTDESLPPPMLIPTSRPFQSLGWKGPQTLAQLRVGEFILRTHTGKIFRKRAAWKNKREEAGPSRRAIDQ